jgi:hypothetical protein
MSRSSPPGNLGRAVRRQPSRSVSPTGGSDRDPHVEGQGISWDLSGPRPTLWAIKRSTKQVLQFEVPYRDIAEPRPDDWHVNGPGSFEP